MLEGILILLVLTLVHEGGHFALASWLRVKIEEVGLGVGPRLISKKWGEVKVSLNLLPLGAYVRPSPEASAAMPAWKEAAISAAGPGANFAFAVLALAVVLTMRGVDPFTSLVVGAKVVLAAVGVLAKGLGSLVAAGAGGAGPAPLGVGVQAALLSILLGAANLLPVPCLDGAKILLVPFRRRWRGIRVVEAIGFVGLMAFQLWLIGIVLYRWATV